MSILRWSRCNLSVLLDFSSVIYLSIPARLHSSKLCSLCCSSSGSFRRPSEGSHLHQWERFVAHQDIEFWSQWSIDCWWVKIWLLLHKTCFCLSSLCKFRFPPYWWTLEHQKKSLYFSHCKRRTSRHRGRLIFLLRWVRRWKWSPEVDPHRPFPLNRRIYTEGFEICNGETI